jgi:hypothetical protein
MTFTAKINPYFLYAGLKLFSVVVMMVAFEPLFGRSYFSYPDFAHYATCNPHSPNGLYSLVICALGVRDIAAPQVVAVALILMTFRDVVFIKLAAGLMSRPALLFFAALLGAHPYLAAYHGRLTTISVASLAILLLFWLIQSGRMLSVATAVMFVVLAGMRNAIAPIFMAFIAISAPAALRQHAWLRIALMAATVLALTAVLQAPDNYAGGFLEGAGRYPLSMSNILGWIDSGNQIVDYIAAIPLLIVSHGVLLLGFREAAFTSFPAPFWPISLFGTAQLIVFSSLAIGHFIGMISFYRYLGSARPALYLLLLTVIPSFLIVSHMRYFLPLIPLAVLGLALALDRKSPQTDLEKDSVNSI